MQPPRFPPLASVCSRIDAMRQGYDVATSTTLLHRYAYAKQRLAMMAAAWLPSTSEWEVKGALALHAWLDAEGAAALYARIAELREPPPGMNDVPDPALEQAFDEALASAATSERVAVSYGLLRAETRQALEDYLVASNPLCDQPSHLVIRRILDDENTMAVWASAASAAIAASSEGDRAEAARRRVDGWLRHARGIDGLGPAGPRPSTAVAPGRYSVDILPRRDRRFTGLFDPTTPADLAYLDETRPADERNAALLFKRVREMDVPEVLAGIIGERWAAARNAVRDGNAPADPGWSWYVNMLRQTWDEARHALLGETLLESHGVDWRQLPINVTFSYKLARYCSPVERHILLYAIEQSLMPRAKGKPYERQVAVDSGDRLSALFHDFDWADEVLHVEIARRCLRSELAGGLAEARARSEELWQRIADALERDPLPAGDAPLDWWSRYVRAVTGKEPKPLDAGHVKDWRPTSG